MQDCPKQVYSEERHWYYAPPPPISVQRLICHSNVRKSDSHQSYLGSNPLICTLARESHYCYFLSRPLRNGSAHCISEDAEHEYIMR